jgi:hypothetical protein
LLISGGVIIVIVFMLVQKIQISLIVVGAILFSIADVVGLLYGARFSAEIYTRGCHWIPRLLA